MVRIILGGDDGVRTHDPLLAGQVLSQLSYTPRRVTETTFSRLRLRLLVAFGIIVLARLHLASSSAPKINSKHFPAGRKLGQSRSRYPWVLERSVMISKN